MSDGSKIEWLGDKGATWNPVTGCTPVSEGCRNCYAKRMARRMAGRYGYPEGDGFAVTGHIDKLDQPKLWQQPRRIFVSSMGDLFHEAVPFAFIEQIWMTMSENLRHTYIILTKRVDRMAQFVTERALGNYGPLPLRHIWLLATTENQRRYDERWAILQQIPAAVRGVSVEPMLGPIDMGKGPYADWVICGAETGPGARRMEGKWAKDLADQCEAAKVPFFLKRLSNGSRELDGQRYEEYPNGIVVSSGRQLEPGEVVHHKNGNRADNRIDNLQVMLAAGHSRLHALKMQEQRRARKSCVN